MNRSRTNHDAVARGENMGLGLDFDRHFALEDRVYLRPPDVPVAVLARALGEVGHLQVRHLQNSCPSPGFRSGPVDARDRPLVSPSFGHQDLPISATSFVQRRITYYLRMPNEEGRRIWAHGTRVAGHRWGFLSRPSIRGSVADEQGLFFL